VDFVTEDAGRVELFESKWTELPTPADAVNLEFVKRAMGRSRVAGGGIICRAPHGFPLSRVFRALPPTELD
jgi:hypothetical protein